MPTGEEEPSGGVEIGTAEEIVGGLGELRARPGGWVGPPLKLPCYASRPACTTHE